MMRAYLVRLTVGVAIIFLMGFLITTAVKAGSQCYPSTNNCLTHAEYIHTVENTLGSYWAGGVSSKTTNP